VDKNLVEVSNCKPAVSWKDFLRYL
jgi:hypothetical protein